MKTTELLMIPLDELRWSGGWLDGEVQVSVQFDYFRSRGGWEYGIGDTELEGIFVTLLDEDTHPSPEPMDAIARLEVSILVRQWLAAEPQERAIEERVYDLVGTLD